jgi:hypothetical protein
MTEEDVFLVWRDCYHTRNKRIENLFDAVSDDLIVDILDANKFLVVLVDNITRYSKVGIKRYEFNLLMYRKYFANEPPLGPDDLGRCRISNYIKYHRTVDLSAFNIAYRCSHEFSDIKIIQPEQDQIINERAMHASPHHISRHPRVTLYPRYGVDWRYNLQHSIPIDHQLEWTPLVRLAYTLMEKQFFNGVLQ